MTAPEVVVVGSANLDIVVPVPHHVAPGETVLGGDHRLVPGGKGANQAVAAARLGRRTAFVGRVGDDDAGRTLRRSLDDAGVHTGALAVCAGPSGIALITVTADGENAIVVSPGANAALTPDDVEAAAGILGDAAVVLLQLEVPLPAVLAAARAAGGTVVLNPAPAPATPLPVELLAEVDVLVPNAGELEVLLAGAPPGPDPATRLGVPAVVTTLGPRGARVQPAGAAAVDVPAPAVVPVDTTAAGDAFCGALADALCRGLGLEAAARWAVRVGAAATLTPGAQPSLPTTADVERLLP